MGETSRFNPTVNNVGGLGLLSRGLNNLLSPMVPQTFSQKRRHHGVTLHLDHAPPFGMGILYVSRTDRCKSGLISFNFKENEARRRV